MLGGLGGFVAQRVASNRPGGWERRQEGGSYRSAVGLLLVSRH